MLKFDINAIIHEKNEMKYLRILNLIVFHISDFHNLKNLI